MTLDETWLYHYDPETRQSNNRRSGGIAAHPAPPPKIPSAKILWKSSRLDFFGIKTASSSLIIFQKAKLSTRCITHLCRCWQMMDILKEKRQLRGKVTKWVLSLHDNAPTHRALATRTKLAYLGFHCLGHPPYSSNLAPSDYHLFPGLKKNN